MEKTTTLPADLSRLIEQARRAAAERNAAEVRHGYCLAVVAHAARQYSTQGGSVVEACARALGIARSTLQQYATVALRWSSSEVEHLLEHNAEGGHPLTISHLLVLARQPRAARERWIARVRTEGLDVHALRALLRRQETSTPA